MSDSLYITLSAQIPSFLDFICSVFSLLLFIHLSSPFLTPACLFSLSVFLLLYVTQCIKIHKYFFKSLQSQHIDLTCSCFSFITRMHSSNSRGWGNSWSVSHTWSNLHIACLLFLFKRASTTAKRTYLEGICTGSADCVTVGEARTPYLGRACTRPVIRRQPAGKCPRLSELRVPQRLSNP